MISILGVGLEYKRLKESDVQGDYKYRQSEYARHLKDLTRIVYSPHILDFKNEMYGNNIEIHYTSSRSKFAYPLDAIRITRRILKKKRVDVISAEDFFIAGFTGILMKHIFKIPLNIQIDNDRVDNPFWLKERKRNRFYNVVAKWVVKRADTLRVMSSDVKKKLARLGIKEDKIWVVPTPVNINRFENKDPSLFRKQKINKRFTKIVLFVGRLSPEKNIPLLLRAFSLILKTNPSTLLVIVGSGKEEKSMKSMAADLKINDNVMFASNVPNDEIGFYFAVSDMFVLSSLHEGRANVLIEAALCKKPIVVTNISGAREWVIDNKTGFIVSQTDYKQLAEKILFLLDNHERAQKFGEEGYTFVKQKLKGANEIEKLIQCWEETAKNNFKR